MNALLQFDPDTHEYRENGIVRRSVTQLLNDCGLVNYDHVPPRVLEHKAEIGVAAHAASHYFDEGDLDWSTIDPEVLGYVNAWAKFRMECDFIPRRIETRGIGEMSGVRYGFTFDCEGIFNGFPTLIEKKCTASIEPSWGPQTAAYEHALFREDGVRRRRVAVHLRPNGTYGLFKMTEVQDYQIFRVALTKPDGWQTVIENWLASKGREFNHGNANESHYEYRAS